MSEYEDPKSDPDGYKEWLRAMGLNAPDYGNTEGRPYDPDRVMNRLFIEGIEEQTDNDGFLNQTYSATFLGKPYGKVEGCEDYLWNNKAPQWGKKEEVTCKVFSDVISQDSDAATKFVLKTCRFDPKPFGDRFYAQHDDHLTPTDLKNMCTAGKSFVREIQNNTKSLSYMNSFYDNGDPKKPQTGDIQTPVLIFYGQEEINRGKVQYPMLGADIQRDGARDVSEECTTQISARDEEVKKYITLSRNTFLDPNTSEQEKKDSMLAATISIKNANKNVAKACFPDYNKTSDKTKSSLKLDTIAGNIFQIATLPTSQYDELEQWIGSSAENKTAFESKGVAAFSDSQCRNARTIGHHLCRNLPRALITQKDIESLYRSCGYAQPLDARISQELRILKTGWDSRITEIVEAIEINDEDDYFTESCKIAKDGFMATVKNVDDRITKNPALGGVGKVTCGALKDVMACGEFTEGIRGLPAVPQFEDGPDTKIRNFVYNALLGGINENFNCVNARLDRPFEEACMLLDGSNQDRNDIKAILGDTQIQRKLAESYGFSLDKESFSDDCKALTSEEGQLQCHIFSKIVPEVCGNKDRAQKVCDSFMSK
jgi:hypothetical protein